jgi:hypothetical protein
METVKTDSLKHRTLTNERTDADVLGFVHHAPARTAEPLENMRTGDNAAGDRIGSPHGRVLVTTATLSSVKTKLNGPCHLQQVER